MGCINTLNQDSFPPNMDMPQMVLNPLGTPIITSENTGQVTLVSPIPYVINTDIPKTGTTPDTEPISSKSEDYKHKKRYNHASFRYMIAN